MALHITSGFEGCGSRELWACESGALGGCGGEAPSNQTLVTLVLSSLQSLADVAAAERVCRLWRHTLVGTGDRAAPSTFWLDHFNRIIRPLCTTRCVEQGNYFCYDGEYMPPPGRILVANMGPTLTRKRALRQYTERFERGVLPRALRKRTHLPLWASCLSFPDPRSVSTPVRECYIVKSMFLWLKKNTHRSRQYHRRYPRAPRHDIDLDGGSKKK